MPPEDEPDEITPMLRQFKANVFRVLANPTRIHIIECLRNEELPVKELQEQLGVEASNASQHLAILRANGLVRYRREGNLVYYSLRDPFLTDVLDAMKEYFLSHLEDAQKMLRGIHE